MTLSSPSHSIVFVSPTWIARADFVGRWNQKRSAVFTTKVDRIADLCDGVKQALALDSSKPRKLTVLSTLIWTDFLMLPRDVVNIAHGDELGQALALEAEVETQISAFSSKTAYIRCDDRRHDLIEFCVSQLDQDQFNQISDLTKSLGVRLNGIAHPATIGTNPNSLKPDELRESIGYWNSQQSQELFDEAAFETLADVWAQTRTLHNSLAIQLETSHPKISQSLVGGTLVAATVASMFGWNNHLDNQLKKVKTQTQQLEQQQESLAETEASNKKLDAKLVQLRRDFADAQQLQQAAENKSLALAQKRALRNQRWSRLVNALAQANQSCWVQRIEGDESQTLVHGVAINQVQAQKFAVDLESNLAGSGWCVAPSITNPLGDQLVSFSVGLLVNDSLPSESRWSLRMIESPLQTPQTELAYKETSR